MKAIAGTPKPQRILLTGGTGRLGRALLRLRPELLAPPRAAFDLTDPRQLALVLRQERPDLVLHAAALVGRRETEAEAARAWAVNGHGTRYLAELCGELGLGLLYVSTVAVFDGRRGRYSEADPPSPAYLYGETKLAGEEAVARLPDGQIVRIDFFDPGRPWKHGAALTDHFCSKVPVLEAARQLLLVADHGWPGLLHLGGPRRGLHDLLAPWYPGLPAVTIAQSAMPDFPRDLSLITARFEALAQQVGAPAYQEQQPLGSALARESEP